MESLLLFKKISKFAALTKAEKNIMSQSDVLKQIALKAKEVLPADARLLLFGSRARGDARPDSDWDLIILLNKEKRAVKDINDYACPFMELGYELNEEINPIVYTSTEWNQRSTTMLRHFVDKEGVEIWH